MTQKIIYPLLIFCFFSFLSAAQKYDYVWITGYTSSTIPDTSNFGTTFLDFNHKPVKVTRKWASITFDKSNTTLSDKSGNLIFSTNAKKVIGKDLKAVKNGDTMLIYKDFKYGLRSEQGLIALPMPNDSNKFYIIYGNRLLKHTYPVYYSIFNSQLGSNGELEKKNEKLIKDSIGVGRITAVKHGNGKDWWVHLRKEDNNHIWLRLTNENLKETHRQIIGSNLINGLGQSVFSPDGKIYVECNSVSKSTGEDIDIYDFDRCEGLLYNHRKIHFDSISWCGCAISSNSRYLYYSNSLHILQYDLYASDIKASETIVANIEYFVDFTPVSFYLMQLAPDGKIYINSTGGCRYMHTIENPDEKGVACNVKQRSIKLFTYNLESIPNHPNYRLGALKGSPCDTLHGVGVATKDIENNFDVKVYPNPANENINLSWNNDINRVVTITLIDILGKVLFKANSIENNLIIDTSQFPTGAYQLKINTEDNSNTDIRKIIINH